MLKFGILLRTSVSHIRGEIDFVGEKEIQMSIHESFFSLVLIQLLTQSLGGVQRNTLMFEVLCFRGEKLGLCLHLECQLLWQ